MFLKPWTTPLNDLLFVFKCKDNNLKHSLKYYMMLRTHCAWVFIRNKCGFGYQAFTG
jgi:hypothetical protein